MAQEFSARFARHKDELEWLFMELYNNREGLEVLEREMADAYDARSAELKALDKARAADPNWYKRGNMFGMTMYTDLFAGNLKELAKKLPYFKEQKLTYLHLMPLLQMPHPHNDGGYAVEDFDTVDPALGTNKDLENLTRELRKAGISLCLDFVMNHTSALMHIINSIGDAVDPMTTRIILENCIESGIIPSEVAKLIATAVSASVLQAVPVEYRNTLRAALLKQLLLTQIK